MNISMTQLERGDEGETDATGPWNTGRKWKIVEQPDLEQGVENFPEAHGSGGTNSKPATSKLRGLAEEAAPKRKRSA
jgi:hypothetical protein